MTVKYRTFSGGYRFAEFEGQPASEITCAPIPELLIIPLKQGFRDAVKPTVSVGDKVAAGQIIGRDDYSFSSPIHAGANGTVEDIRVIESPDGTVEAVVIKTEETGSFQPLEGCSANWTELSRDDIESLVYLSGAASSGDSGIPTKFRSSPILPKDVEHVIIQAVGSEIYHPALSALLSPHNIPRFVEGIRILQKMMPEASFHLAADSGQKRLFDEMAHNLAGKDGFDEVEICLVSSKYPQHRDEVLLPTMLDKPFPSGHRAANTGVIILDIQSLLHVREAVVEGKPVIERLIALAGPGFDKPHHVIARVGTTVDSLLEDHGEDVRYVINSPLTGAALTDMDTPITRTLSALVGLTENRTREFMGWAMPGLKRDSHSRTFLSRLLCTSRIADTNIRGEKRPCVFCNFCQDVCPVGLLPYLIYKYSERNIIDEKLVDLKISKCLGCNLCSYVCPCKIPVSKYIREGKDKLREEGLDPIAIPYDLQLKGALESSSQKEEDGE